MRRPVTSVHMLPRNPEVAFIPTGQSQMLRPDSPAGHPLPSSVPRTSKAWCARYHLLPPVTPHQLGLVQSLPVRFVPHTQAVVVTYEFRCFWTPQSQAPVRFPALETRGILQKRREPYSSAHTFSAHLFTTVESKLEASCKGERSHDVQCTQVHDSQSVEIEIFWI